MTHDIAIIIMIDLPKFKWTVYMPHVDVQEQEKIRSLNFKKCIFFLPSKARFMYCGIS